MEDSGQNAVENFKLFTGCKNDAEARQLLEACNDDIAMAADLYFQQHQPTSTVPSGSQTSNFCTDFSSSSRHRIAHRNRFPSIATTRTRRAASMNGASVSRKPADEEDVNMVDGDDNVRAPIAPRRGAIIEQSFSEQYQNHRRRVANSVFDSYRDFRPDSDEHLSPVQNGLSSAGTSRVTLQALFRPPLEIIHHGDWESARAEAQRINSWLLVNVQDVQEFACQTLNRDVWANAAVKELIRSNFLFWQIYHDSADGIRIGTYYRIKSYPSIFVVDPRTGELLTHLRAQDAVSFCDQVTTFLDTFPDFAARDRHLVGAAAPTHSAEPTPSISARRQDCKDEDMNAVSSSSNGGRKRPLDNLSNEMYDECVEAKKSRQGEDMPDIDAIVKSGNKLTTVDYDEWRSYLGVPDGKGVQISLMLRFPGGDRKNVQVEDTTPLKAIFMLTAGMGYSPCDHLLILFYPKREYTLENGDRTLRELGFNRQEVIHVERK